MLFDNSLVFDPFSFNGGTPTAITASAASANVYDITGLGSGVNASTYIQYGQGAHAAAVFGDDYGLGSFPDKPTLFALVATTFLTCTSVIIAIQAAIDNGSGSPGSWVTIGQTSAIPVASLTAGAAFQLPLPAVNNALVGGNPRFYRLYYTVAGSNATAGAFSSAIVLGAWSTFAGVTVNNNYADWIG